MKVTHNYNSLLDDYNQLIKEQELMTRENKELHQEQKQVKLSPHLPPGEAPSLRTRPSGSTIT